MTLHRPKTKVRLVGKLRYLCREDQFPDKQAKLRDHADKVLFTITSLGLEFAPASRIENCVAYWDAANYIEELTGEKWPGEAAEPQWLAKHRAGKKGLPLQGSAA